jgi:hypothetical protein
MVQNLLGGVFPSPPTCFVSLITLIIVVVVVVVIVVVVVVVVVVVFNALALREFHLPSNIAG